MKGALPQHTRSIELFAVILSALGLFLASGRAEIVRDGPATALAAPVFPLDGRRVAAAAPTCTPGKP